jgi:hypothetical protein
MGFRPIASPCLKLDGAKLDGAQRKAKSVPNHYQISTLHIASPLRHSDRWAGTAVRLEQLEALLPHDRCEVDNAEAMHNTSHCSHICFDGLSD